MRWQEHSDQQPCWDPPPQLQQAPWSPLSDPLPPGMGRDLTPTCLSEPRHVSERLSFHGPQCDPTDPGEKLGRSTPPSSRGGEWQQGKSEPRCLSPAPTGPAPSQHPCDPKGGPTGDAHRPPPRASREEAARARCATAEATRGLSPSRVPASSAASEASLLPGHESGLSRGRIQRALRAEGGRT